MFTVFLCINVHTCSEKQTLSCDAIRDTIYDTITYLNPIPKDSIVLKYVTAKLPDADDKEDNFPIISDTNSSDCSDVIIPITQKVYTDDSTYIAYVSGYMASLDSFSFMRRTETIINTIPRPTVKDKRWCIGVQIGYGITTSSTPQFTPYIGIGLSYKLFNF